MLPHTELVYIAQYGYLALFAIIVGSELVTFLPVGVLLIFMGALAHAGYYNLFFLLLVAAFGASLSDYLVFTIARRIGRQEGYRRYVEGNRFAARIENYMSRFPLLTIIVSRFVGITTSATNAVAGLSQLSRPTFILADGIGNLACCLIYLCIGYFLGIAWAVNAHVAAIVIGIIAVVFVVGYLTLYLLLKRR